MSRTLSLLSLATVAFALPLAAAAQTEVQQPETTPGFWERDS